MKMKKIDWGGGRPSKILQRKSATVGHADITSFCSGSLLVMRGELSHLHFTH